MNKYPFSESITGADAYCKNYAPEFFDSSFISLTVTVHNKTSKVIIFEYDSVCFHSIFLCLLNVVPSRDFLSFPSDCGFWLTGFPHNFLRVNKEHDVRLNRN